VRKSSFVEDPPNEDNFLVRNLLRSEAERSWEREAESRSWFQDPVLECPCCQLHARSGFVHAVPRTGSVQDKFEEFGRRTRINEIVPSISGNFQKIRDLRIEMWESIDDDPAKYN
jgi:hypothetical protein